MYHLKIVRKLETDPIPKSALRNGKSIEMSPRVEMPLNASKKYIGIVARDAVYVAEIRLIREDDFPYTTFGGTANATAQDKQEQAWQGFLYTQHRFAIDKSAKLAVVAMGKDKGRCRNCLNSLSVGNNLLGLSYLGGNNPRSYNKQYN